MKDSSQWGKEGVLGLQQHGQMFAGAKQQGLFGGTAGRSVLQEQT